MSYLPLNASLASWVAPLDHLVPRTLGGIPGAFLGERDVPPLPRGHCRHLQPCPPHLQQKFNSLQQKTQLDTTKDAQVKIQYMYNHNGKCSLIITKHSTQYLRKMYVIHVSCVCQKIKHFATENLISCNQILNFISKF